MGRCHSAVAEFGSPLNEYFCDTSKYIGSEFQSPSIDLEPYLNRIYKTRHGKQWMKNNQRDTDVFYEGQAHVCAKQMDCIIS